MLCDHFSRLAHRKVLLAPINTRRMDAQHWGKSDGISRAGLANKGISLFGCVFIGEENGKAVLSFKRHPTQPLEILTGEDLKHVKKANGTCGSAPPSQSLGRSVLGESDLGDTTVGSKIVAELVRRFPLLIIDELQDTGYFLGKSVLRILSDPNSRGVLVGDPDQSIFEFNGARPDLFRRFEEIAGAVQYSLPTSLRCPSAIATVASHLKDSEGAFGPAKGQPGRAFLVCGTEEDMVCEIKRLINGLKLARPLASIKILARQNATVDALVGKSAKKTPRLGLPALSHMHRAVVAFHHGSQANALAANTRRP